MILALIGAIFAVRSGSMIAIIVDSLFLGAVFGLAFGGSLRHLSEVTPADSRGRVMSAYYLLGYLGMCVLTVIAGALANQFGTATIFPWFAGAVALGCFGAAVLGLAGRRPTATETPVPLP